MKRLALICGLLLALVACNTPSSLTKKGDKLQLQNMHLQAADYYYQALHKKSDYINAQVGLKTSGQRVVNHYLDEFFKAKNYGDNKKAIYLYRDAESYQQKVARFNIALDIPAHYTSDFNSMLSTYVDGLYAEAIKLLDKEEFAASEDIFSEIALLKPDFKDVDELKEVAIYEPKYRQANELLENEKFRASYYVFAQIPASYKDTEELQALALETGLFTIGLLEFKNASTTAGGEAAVSAYLTERITKLNNPFVKLIDRSHTQTLLNEQLMGLSGQVDGSTAAQAGELIGAKAILTGTLVSFNKEVKPLKRYPKKAWYERSVRKYNKETEKYYYEKAYDKIWYHEYAGSNKASVSFQFQLISAESGEILLNDIIRVELEDKVHYAASEKNYKNILPGTWKHEKQSLPGDEIYTTYIKETQLRSLFKANRELRSIDQLADELYKEIANKVSAQINSYNPEK
jgi:hypothetical protein